MGGGAGNWVGGAARVKEAELEEKWVWRWGWKSGEGRSWKWRGRDWERGGAEVRGREGETG